MGTKKVRVLVPYQARYLNAGAGDVVEIDSAQADGLIASGIVEAAPNADVGPYEEPATTPVPEPLPVGAGPYEAPESAKAQLDVGEGGNTPPSEPLPVGSGPYEAPEAAKAQLDVGEGGANPPAEPLVSDEEPIRPTDEKGQPVANISEATEDVLPADTALRDYEGWKVPELKAELAVRGLEVGGKKAELVKRLKADDAEE